MKLDVGMFKSTYQRAIAQQAPRMYRELKAAGVFQEHLEDITRQAAVLFDEVLDNLKKLEGSIDQSSVARAREVVYHEMLQFQDEP